MPTRTQTITIILLLVLATVTAGCGAAPGSPSGTVGQQQPTKLRIALANQTSLEQPWNQIMVDALKRVIAAKPRGLEIEYTWVENVAYPDGERVFRELAKTGEYGIIIVHGGYHDAAEILHKEFPDILWVATGGGWPPEIMGDNLYWLMYTIHEPAYLAGIIAGYMTKSGMISAVGSFPYATTNGPVRAFFEGAKSVKPDVKTRMAYIESWFDPPKAKTYAEAQISAGSDAIYAEVFGVYEAAKGKGVYAFGHYQDQHELAPDIVLASTMIMWDPYLTYLVDTWWDHVVNKVPYNAPKNDNIRFTMKQGGVALSPYYSLEGVIPTEAKAKVEEVKNAIMAGTFTVPLDESPIEAQ